MRPALLALTLAGPAPVDVDWHGDPTCPSDQDFKNDLETHLRGGEATTQVHARVDVARAADLWSLELTLTTPDGASTRRLTGASCAAVSAAAAFITALVVDPALLTRAAPPEPSPDPTPKPEPPREPNPIPPRQTPLTPPPPPRSTPRPRGFLRIAGGLEALGMPRVGPQFNPAVGVLGQRWRVEATALYRAPTRAATDTPGVGGLVRLWSIGLRGCGVPSVRRLELPLCLGVEAGQAIGDGDGDRLSRSQRARLPWLAAVVSPALVWAPSRSFAVWAGLDAAIALIPGTFAVAGFGDVHRIGPVSLRAGLGLEWRFP